VEGCWPRGLCTCNGQKRAETTTQFLLPHSLGVDLTTLDPAHSPIHHPVIPGCAAAETSRILKSGRRPFSRRRAKSRADWLPAGHGVLWREPWRSALAEARKSVCVKSLTVSLHRPTSHQESVSFRTSTQYKLKLVYILKND